jgi:hypothetical protein
MVGIHFGIGFGKGRDYGMGVVHQALRMIYRATLRRLGDGNDYKGNMCCAVRRMALNGPMMGWFLKMYGFAER